MHHTERTGMLLAVLGFSVLSLGDAVIKSMAGAWPVMAVAALRFAISAVALGVAVAVKEGPRALFPRDAWLQLGRGLSTAISSLSFFAAIFIMPMAETVAIVFLSPVLTAILSGPLLGEKVRRAVWFASAMSLVGVALVLRPNLAELGLAAFLPVLTAVFMSLVFILNRASAGRGSILSMQFFNSGIAAVVLVAVAFLARDSGLQMAQFGWPDWDVVARCALVAITATTAHWLIYSGTMRAGASQIAPASYVQLLVATALGWWIFGNRPDFPTLAGAACIVFAGIYLWRDSKRMARLNAVG